jgi:REP element-mobilizing transposase RayT
VCFALIVWLKFSARSARLQVGLRVRELLREICGQQEVTIIKGHISKDHVHLFVSVPPRVTISRLMQMLRGKSSFKLIFSSTSKQSASKIRMQPESGSLERNARFIGSEKFNCNQETMK